MDSAVGASVAAICLVLALSPAILPLAQGGTASGAWIQVFGYGVLVPSDAGDAFVANFGLHAPVAFEGPDELGRVFARSTAPASACFTFDDRLRCYVVDVDVVGYAIPPVDDVAPKVWDLIFDSPGAVATGRLFSSGPYSQTSGAGRAHSPDGAMDMFLDLTVYE